MNKKLRNKWFDSMSFQKTVINILTAFIINRKKRRNIRRKWLAKIKKLYLSQYLYAINKNVNDNGIKIEKNKIWICWFQGEENAPDIVKTCIKSIKKYKPDNMEVIIITNENIRKYANIPKYMYKKLNNKQMSYTQFSDILRLSLLTIHGGMWIDSTVLLTATIPNKILNSKYFAFHSTDHGLTNNNWFVKAEQNFYFIKTVRNLMFEYWKNEEESLDYFNYQLFVDLLTEKFKKFKKEWNKTPLYWDDNCYDFGDQLLLQPYNEKKFNEILKKTPIHKLKYKYDQTADIKGTFLEKIIQKNL